MDLHLQHVRSGETTKLSPERTLIGTADHATLRTEEGGPYLAALAVRYPTGWAVFGLSDSGVMFNRQPLRAGQRVTPKRGDLLVVGTERFTFVAPGSQTAEPEADVPAPGCFAYIQNPDGMEECRAVDHDLLFGRMPFCHVQLADPRLSRLSALLAVHGGEWYVHTLSKKPLGRNRKPVNTLARLVDGDELQIGPLVVRIEIRPGTGERPALEEEFDGSDSTESLRRPLLQTPPPAGATDFEDATEDGSGEKENAPNPSDLRAAVQQLEQWLKTQDRP